MHGRALREVVVRMLADAVLINVGLLVALSALDLDASLMRTLGAWAVAAPLLTCLTLAIVLGSGSYTWARRFRMARKLRLLVVGQTAAFTVVLVLTEFLPTLLPIPPLVLVGAWLATMLLMVSARVWSRVWRDLILADQVAEPSRRPRTVLVIGGAGYVGSFLCRALLDRGYRVRVLDALLYGDESIRDLTSRADFELIEGDSRDITSLVRGIRGVDAVVHLGEIVGDPACALDEHLTLEVNLAATRMAAEVARGFAVQRFVYASSCSVYGASDATLDEKSRLNPVSLYARTKIGAERVLLGLRGSNFHPVIVRLATVYGLSFRPRFDLVVNTLAAKAWTEGEITVYGGAQWRPFVHVADVAQALLLCLERPLATVDGQIFNVGSAEQNYTISEVADLVQSCVPGARIHRLEGVGDPRNYRVSFHRIRDQLGFRPRRTVVDGIREIVAALQAGVVQAYADPRHDNARSLRADDGSLRIRAHQVAPLYQAHPAGLAQLLVSAEDDQAEEQVAAIVYRPAEAAPATS